MRVAHVITRLIVGGAQENTLLNCEDLLRDYGDQVLLLTGPPAGPEGSLLDRAYASGVPVELLGGLGRAVRPWADWASYRALKAALARFAPDVVHTHSAKGGMLGRAAAWSLGVPAIVHTVHGAPFHPYQRPLARALIRQCERWAARRCHALISVADAMTGLMVAGGVAPRDKFTTIYSGMEVEPFLRAEADRQAVRRRFGFDAGHVVVGKIARLFPLKGHEFLIAAARDAVAAAPRLRFLLVGDGVLRPSLEQAVAAAGLTEHVRFAGLVPPAEVPSLIGAMDMVVHTSLREGLARVLPQALLAGRPAISYDIDGAREVVLDGVTGRLLPPKEVAGLSRAILELAGDPAARARMGREGQGRFRKLFDHNEMTRQVRRLYEQLLAGRAEAISLDSLP